MKIDFENLSMSEIVGLVNDPNRCPGAANSIRRVLQEAMLPSNSLIVEIGSNTGFTSIEFALRKPDSKVVGIDVNKPSVELAKQKAKKHGVKNVTFYVDDATNIKKVKPKSADLLFASNVTSFIKDKETALKNYDALLKDGGILCLIPIHYHTLPSESLRKKVEALIGTDLSRNKFTHWESLFSKNLKSYSLFFREDYNFASIPRVKIKEYVETVFNECKTLKLSKEDDEKLKNRFFEMLVVFNENLKHCHFTILLYRKTLANAEPQLNQYIKIN